MDGPDYPPESWGVDYIVIPGDPAKLETWQQLDYLLAGEWKTEDGRSLRLGGLRRIQLGDRQVEYQTGADLDAAIKQARHDVAALDLAESGVNPYRRYGTFYRD